MIKKNVKQKQPSMPRGANKSAKPSSNGQDKTVSVDNRYAPTGKPKLSKGKAWRNIEFAPNFYIGVSPNTLAETLEIYRKYTEEGVLSYPLVQHHLGGRIELDGKKFEIWYFIAKHHKTGEYTSYPEAYEVERFDTEQESDGARQVS
jgi:hypothetical protein